jgi:hypothetical protein
VSRSPYLLGLLLGLAAQAEDEPARRAREELERQLSALVGERPARVRIDFQALDEPGYALREAVFQLDGSRLLTPSVDALQREGDHRVWSGEVRPGRHNVLARVTYQNEASVVVSDEGGYAWRLSGDVSFEVQAGLEVQVRVAPERDGSQRELARRLRLRLPATPVMLARVDDSPLPEPPARPPAVAEASSGGAPLPDEWALPGARALRDRPPARRPSLQDPAVAPRAQPWPSPEPPAGPDGPGLPARAVEPPSGGAPAPAEAVLLPATRPPPDAPTEPVATEGEVPWAVLAGVGAALAVAGALALLVRRRARPPSFRE